MEEVIPVWKAVGVTPLQAIKLFKSDNPTYSSCKISYAGRLDPMAEGVLVLLVGEANKKRNIYEKLQKEYIVEMVLGISTDSFDSLGLILKTRVVKVSESDVEKALQMFVGSTYQKYPPYSSKPVNGKPLYWWAKRGRLSEVSIPEKKVFIDSISILRQEKVTGKDIASVATQRASMVIGDFRREEILSCWLQFAEKHTEEEFIKIRMRVACSSGTYMRSLAHDAGEVLGTGAFAYSITRIRVGDFMADPR